MPIKRQDFIIQGMQRDTSEHAFDPKFAYENQNMRITTNPNSSSEHTGDLLAMTNERGNKYTPIEGLEGNNMIGVPIGQCLINNQWVVFTVDRPLNVTISEEVLEAVSGTEITIISTESDIDNLLVTSNSRIYKLWLNEGKMFGELLYEGNLGFDYTHPIETLPYYENEQIQKVYWTDGLNQPRFINIAETAEKRAKWVDTSFDFVATMDLLSTRVEIEESNTGGKFPAGVIQWFFTYSKKFGQETNIFASTRLYELKYSDRGAAPDEMTSQSFKIKVYDCDPNFDYVNVYSVIRTSIDGVPIAKCIGTVPISIFRPYFDIEVPYIEITDSNMYGTAIDPQELFYKGGEKITAYTMEQKDNTLFLGNYTLTRAYINQTLKDDLKEFARNNFYFSTTFTHRPHFRRGNKYRFGIQFQHNTGKWSEVVWIGDYICDVSFDPERETIGRLKLTGDTNYIKQRLIDEGYVKVRPVVIYPTIGERGILTQGVLSNTIYMDKNPSQLYPDYFFRAFSTSVWGTDQSNMDSHSRYWYLKDCWIGVGSGNPGSFDVIRNEYKVASTEWIPTHRTDNMPQVSERYYSLYSPDINFNDAYQIYNSDDISLVREGYITKFNNTPKNEITTSSISKPTEGHRQWVDDGRKMPFYWFWDLHTTEVEVENKTVAGEPKDGESDAPSREVLVSRWRSYGRNIKISWDVNGGCDFVKATADNVDYFWFDPKYPQRLPVYFKPKNVDNRHYVGGFLWEDTFMNVNTDHSELLDKDLPTRSAGFMQYYAQYIYPVMLWQPTGSICYDQANDAASVLKSNRTLNYLVASEDDIDIETPLTFASNKSYKVVNGENIIKLRNDATEGAILYSNRVYDNIIWRDSYSALVYLDPNGTTQFEWGSITPDSKYTYAEEISLSSRGSDFNLGKIEDFSRTLPYDDVETGQQEFKWHNLGREAYRSCVADMRYMSIPNYVIDITENTVATIADTDKKIPIVSIKQTIPTTIFGGTTDDVIQNNSFLVAGDAVSIMQRSGAPIDLVSITWEEGDTYYQTYECLKTYPRSFEDENCVTEVLSVPLETYWNMNCRYDSWKGNPTFATSPANWNLMNPVYNQKDNFFIYHGLDLSVNSVNLFPNSFTWTLTKWSGDTVDKWTQVTMANTMDVDGSKGEITKLIKLQDHLLCFQPRGLSQILYNEREQISTGSGVPIQIANSGKVNGTRYVTEKTGCNNKWSICKTESGLYWIDDENKQICAWNQQLVNLSDMLGFHSWINDVSELKVWNPLDFKSFVTYYDPYYESVMFIYKDRMLSYNTQLNCFDSFFSYGSVPYYAAFECTAFTLSDKDSDGKDTYKVWEQHKGHYNYFYVHDVNIYKDGNVLCKGMYDKDGNSTGFGYEPYFTTILVNPDMPYDKIFNNFDMRTDMWDKDNNLLEETYSHLEVWNEYQHNKSRLIRRVDIPKIHFPQSHSILQKKFRVWYGNIPRDTKTEGTRYYNRDRMRNTWLYFKLSKELIDDDKDLDFPYILDSKHIIHHIGINYFI